MVARAHVAAFEQAADAIEQLALPRSGEARMRIGVRAAVEGPQLRAARATGFPELIDAGEALMGGEMLVIRPKIIGRDPRLEDFVEIERVQRLRRPACLTERHIGVERRDLERPRR